MSTRAVYGFKDQRDTHHVYVHHDGYPTGAASKFEATLESKLAWELPRFEADEFAASFVAANKKSQGGVRLTHGPEQHGDIEYYYLVSQKNDVLMIDAYDTPFDEFANRKLIFSGTLSDFIAGAEKIEQAA